METGNTFMVPIGEIQIGPRQRKDLDQQHLEELKVSIEENGLFHPITLRRADDKSLHLSAGFTRLMAHMQLGREHIEAKILDMDGRESKKVELEENLRRKPLEFWEEAQAIDELHELYKEENPKWTTRRTADALGISTGKLSQYRQLAREVKSGDTGKVKIKEQKSVTGALKKIDKAKKLEKRKAASRSRKIHTPDKLSAKVLVGDALELIAKEPDESFDGVISNFPFGIDLEFENSDKPYDDEEREIIDLIRELVPHIYRVLRPDSWAVMFFDSRKLTYSNYQRKMYFEVRDYMRTAPLTKSFTAERKAALLDDLNRSMGLAFWAEEAGFGYITHLPCIWAKPNKTSSRIGDLRRSFATAYESFIFAAKGDAILRDSGVQNIFLYDTPFPSERVFSVQMSKQLCSRLVYLTNMPGARILDPFAGTAMTGLGALDNDCDFVGYEIDKDRAELGNMMISEHEKIKGEKK